MRLYEIAKEMQEVLELLENQEIETDQETLAEYLNKLEGDYTLKLDNIACMIKNQQAIADAIDNEIKNLTERKKQHEKQALRFKEYISTFMQQMGLDKLETARNKITFRKSSAVQVDEEAFKVSYPQFVQRVEIENIPSKPELKKMIENGTVTESAEIVYKQNIQIK